ncbi:TPR-like protein [Neoconidiobolus thromboides FSU 785]|nr:TPR-like protein [Neoconidiobolus thromboides FSU 785]
MIENSKIDNNSWLLIGTILELAEVYKMNNKLTEAIRSFEQALVHLDQNDSIDLNFKDSINKKSLKEEEKNKNKALGIYLELYRLYLKTNDIVQSDQKIEKAIELIFDDYLDNSNKGNTYHELDHKIKKPSWLTDQEYLAAVEEIGSYYIKTGGFHPAIVLYQLALNSGNDPIKKSILYCNLGVAYQGLKYNEFALNAFKQGILILKQVKDVENEDKDKNMSTLLYNLGLTSELSGNKEEAKKYFQQLWKNRGNYLKHVGKKKWKVVKDYLDK